jgi:hypothetical protein
MLADVISATSAGWNLSPANQVPVVYVGMALHPSYLLIYLRNCFSFFIIKTRKRLTGGCSRLAEILRASTEECVSFPYHYYYNSHNKEKASSTETQNTGNTVITIFIHSPFVYTHHYFATAAILRYPVTVIAAL